MSSRFNDLSKNLMFIESLIKTDSFVLCLKNNCLVAEEKVRIKEFLKEFS